MTYSERQTWRLGREVNFALPIFQGLRPSREAMKVAAHKLSISLSSAWEAWNLYTWVAH